MNTPNTFSGGKLPPFFYEDTAELVGSIFFEGGVALSSSIDDGATPDMPGGYRSNISLKMEYPSGYSITNSWWENHQEENFNWYGGYYDTIPIQEIIEVITEKMKKIVKNRNDLFTGEIVNTEIKEIEEKKKYKIVMTVKVYKIDEKAVNQFIEKLQKTGKVEVGFAENDTDNSIYREIIIKNKKRLQELQEEIYKVNEEMTKKMQEIEEKKEKIRKELEIKKQQEFKQLQKIIIGKVNTKKDSEYIYIEKTTETTGKIVILKSLAGIVIGKKGSNIKELQEETGLQKIEVIPVETMNLRREDTATFQWLSIYRNYLEVKDGELKEELNRNKEYQKLQEEYEKLHKKWNELINSEDKLPAITISYFINHDKLKKRLQEIGINIEELFSEKTEEQKEQKQEEKKEEKKEEKQEEKEKTSSFSNSNKKLVKIKSWFLKKNYLFVDDTILHKFFEAEIIKETEKAVLIKSEKIDGWIPKKVIEIKDEKEVKE